MNDEQLKKMAAAMYRTPPNVAKSNIDAGYTYFGQLISHDIVNITRRSNITREVSGALNLGSIYGESPHYTYLLEPEKTGFLKENGRFYLADNKFDFRRLPQELDYVARIPEQRNNHHLIIAQLHVFWMKFHNFLLDKNYVKNALEARKLVTLVFQLIVVEDFLFQILDKNVFYEYFVNNKSYLPSNSTIIPDFFSKASYRFGHSIVRKTYRLAKDASPITLENIFIRNRAIANNEKIDWSGLFSIDIHRNAQKTYAFDTQLTDELIEVPVEKRNVVNIALRNLIAGRQAGLPSGIKKVKEILLQPNAAIIKKELGLTELKSASLATFADVVKNDITKVPLWPYILLEAQVESNGKRLGVLGSMLNAEVLIDSIKKADFSIYDNGTISSEKIINRLGAFGEDIVNFISDWNYDRYSTNENKHETGITMPMLFRFLNETCKPF